MSSLVPVERPERTPQFTDVHDQLQRATNNLQETVAKLRDRLKPVCLPGAAKAVEKDPAPEPHRVPVAALIYQRARDVESCADQIEEILRQLEI